MRAALREAAPRAAPGLFRGWSVVAGAFLVLMVGFGAIYSCSAFADAIAAEFGYSRSAVNLAYALSGSTCFFVSALSGPLTDRVGPRILAAAGMLLVGTGLLLAAAGGTLIEVLLGYGLLIGLGVGLAYVPAVTAVQHWFAVHRGLASGLAVSGIGIGTALVPPMTEALAGFGDWRVAFAISGCLAAVVGIAGALLLDGPPAKRGLTPDGLPPAPGPVVPRGGRAAVMPSAQSQHRAFGLAYAGIFLVSLPVTLPYVLLVAAALDHGVPRQDAVGLLGLIGLGSILGRFLIAAAADLLGRRIIFLGCCLGITGSMLFWATTEALPLLQAFALLFGVVQGGFVALLPAFVADTFGSRSLGRVIGLLYTARGFALLAAPPGFAGLAAWLGGYAWPIGTAALCGAGGTLLLAALHPYGSGRGAMPPARGGT